MQSSTDLQNHATSTIAVLLRWLALPARPRPLSLVNCAPFGLDLNSCSTFQEFRKRDKEGPVQENSYRQSRLCRLLGNPVAFAIVQALADHKELSPSELAQAVGRSVQRVSTVLGALRLADVVRYDTDGKRNRYRLKHPVEVRSVIAALSRFVRVAADPGL